MRVTICVIAIIVAMLSLLYSDSKDLDVYFRKHWCVQFEETFEN